MNRRELLQTAPWAAGTLALLENPVASLAAAPAAGASAPFPRPLTRRWTEQRWVLDNLIQANGVDWDQPRTQYWNAACGLQAGPDFARIRQRVHKYADIAPEFADMAQNPGRAGARGRGCRRD